MKNAGLPFRRPKTLGALRVLGEAVFLAALSAGSGIVFRPPPVLADTSRRTGANPGANALLPGASLNPAWRDSLGDGFPDSARLDSAQDRANFTRWFTFLAETQYYAPTPQSRVEIQDCAALIRYAFRNSLVVHSQAWRVYAALPFDPGFGDVAKFHYPFGPLGRALFRARPGPATPEDLAQGAFVEFADSATLLRYNTHPISRELRAARPGDLLFFHQSVQREPFHTMLFVGRSYFQPQGSDWIVYHTGDMNGHGEVREVQAETLLNHPDLRWRPLLSNPHFLGVYRLEILR